VTPEIVEELIPVKENISSLSVPGSKTPQPLDPKSVIVSVLPALSLTSATVNEVAEEETAADKREGLTATNNLLSAM
jgi:hypothetical protein